MIYKEAVEEGLCFTYWFEVISSGVISSLTFYYISKLVCVLWLVNSTGHTLLCGPLKFKVLFVAKLLHDLSPNFLNIASKSLKLSFTLNCVLKHANGLKTIQMNSFCFRPASEILKPFLVNGNRSRTGQTQNRDIINIILISFFSVRTVSYGSLFFPRSVTYGTDLEIG